MSHFAHLIYKRRQRRRGEGVVVFDWISTARFQQRTGLGYVDYLLVANGRSGADAWQSMRRLAG